MQSPDTQLCLKPGGAKKKEKTKIESNFISIHPSTLFYLKSYKKKASNWYEVDRSFLGYFGRPL